MLVMKGVLGFLQSPCGCSEVSSRRGPERLPLKPDFRQGRARSRPAELRHEKRSAYSVTPSSKGWAGGTSEVLFKGFGQTSLGAFVSSGACALRVLLD